MMSAWLYTGADVKELDPVDISEVVCNPGALVWVDLVTPSEDELQRLQEEFSLHPLALEDVRHRNQRPKLETYPTHSFVVAYSAKLREVDIFIGPQWVITVQVDGRKAEAKSVDSARARFDRVRPDPPTAGFLVYMILDELVDGYIHAADSSEDALEKLEERIFSDDLHDERVIQQELFAARRRLVRFRRAVVPLRDVVTSLMRREVPWIDERTAFLFQDVYDHVLRAIDLLDSRRELLGNAVDAHLAIISNRMNTVMKKMTSWGAILLVSTLVTGIYGMNFEHIPSLGWTFGFFFALGLMATVTLVGYWYFSRKDWL